MLALGNLQQCLESHLDVFEVGLLGKRELIPAGLVMLRDLWAMVGNCHSNSVSTDVQHSKRQALKLVLAQKCQHRIRRNMFRKFPSVESTFSGKCRWSAKIRRLIGFFLMDRGIEEEMHVGELRVARGIGSIIL